MLNKFYLLPLLTAVVTAADRAHLLFGRQGQDSCSAVGQMECGLGCIDLTATCCPDQSGGCALGTYCTLGDNGEYGCCKIGKICTGDGGVTTTYDFSSTPTLPVRTSRVADSSTIIKASTTRIPTLRSTAPLAPTSDVLPTSEAPPLVEQTSRTSTFAAGATSTTRSAATSTAQPASTGAAIYRGQSTSGWLLAIALPFLAL